MTPPEPKPAPRKRAPAKKPPTKPAPATRRPRAVAPQAEPAPTPSPRRHSHRLALLAFAFLLAGSVAAALLLVGGDESPRVGESAAMQVTPAELAAQAGDLETPVYWAGAVPGRKLELRSSAAGTFVRYLPQGALVGSAEQTLTIATYPMRDAYASVVARAKEPGTTSRRAPDRGRAVWNDAQPTSVYLAWPGVPSLVEVYSPEAAEARSTAVGGDVRPVR